MYKIIITIAILTSFMSFKTLKSQDFKHEKFCKKIQVKTTKFDSTLQYFSPVLKPIIVSKSVSGDNIYYYMFFKVVSSYSSENDKGLILILSNGQKVTFEESEIQKTSLASDQYQYTCLLNLDTKHTELLSSFNITDFKLGDFEKEVKKPEQYRGFLMCLKDKH